MSEVMNQFVDNNTNWLFGKAVMMLNRLAGYFSFQFQVKHLKLQSGEFVERCRGNMTEDEESLCSTM